MSTPPIRVMIVDDSSIVRRLLKTALVSSGICEVVYEAQNGREAVKNVARSRADVLIIDVQMPEMDGIETVRTIRAKKHDVRIVMFSSLTSDGADATLAALVAGADDYLEKPQGAKSPSDVLDKLSKQVIPRIASLARKTPIEVPPPECSNVRPIRSSNSIVVIGASTGGPKVISRLLSRIRPDLPIPILIAQHMPCVFTELFAQQLDKLCPLPVREAIDGEVIRPGNVWVAKGGQHLTVECIGNVRRLRLNDHPKDTIAWPSVDVLFESVAQSNGNSALGIILTGMGRDGTAGAKKLKQAGGQVLVQDRESCPIWGMPRMVFESLCCDGEYSIDELTDIINTTSGYTNRSATPLAVEVVK